MEVHIPELKINPEFEKLIDPLEIEERNELMIDLKMHGCVYPIIVWNDTIIDGHNRYKMCKNDNIPFETKQMQFEDTDEAKIWILTNQVARRNLESFRRYEFIVERDKLKKLREKAKEKRLANLLLSSKRVQQEDQNKPLIKGKEKSNLDKSFNRKTEINEKDDITPLNHQKEIAKEIGVSTGTVARMQYIEKNVKKDSSGDEVLKQLRTGKVSVNKLYTDIKKKKRNDIGDEVVKHIMAGKLDEKEVHEAEGNADPPISHGKSLDGMALRSVLRDAVNAVKDITWDDVSKLEPIELRQNVMNELQVLNVRTKDILKGLNGD